uniref:GAGE domain-containing protein n=1 Tax=Propithecus coquereli TaxID=379532 RepID=A0A2K6FAU8_PROCO
TGRQSSQPVEPVVPDIEADLLEFSEAKTGGKRGDGPDVKGEILSNLEPVQVPEAGEGQPEV